MRYKQLVDVILMCFNVLLFIPSLFVDILTGSKRVKITIPLFLSIFAFYFVPPFEYDLYRHYYNYDNYRVTKELLFLRDYLIVVIFYLGDAFNLKRNFIPFVSCFILYFFWFRTFELNKFEVKNKPVVSLYIFIYLLSIPLVLFSGVRFGIGLALCVYGVVRYYDRKKTNGYFYLLLAAFSHFSFFIIPLVIIAVEFFNKQILRKRNQLILIIISLTSLLFTQELALSVARAFDWLNINVFGWNMFSIESYITGDWGLERVSNLNSTGRIFFYIKTYGLLALMLFYSLFINLRGEKIHSFVFIMVVFCVFSFNFSTIFLRYGLLVTLMMVYLNVGNRVSGKAKLSFFISLVLYLLLMRALDFNDNFDVFINSYSDFYNFSLFSIFYELF